MTPMGESSKKRPHLIVNAASGSYSRRRMNKTIGNLSRAGVTPHIHEIATFEEAGVLCDRIKNSDANPFFIVAAGDGTINAVLNSIDPGSATLALLPLGTSNVLARELGIHSVDDGVSRIVRCAARPLAVGLLKTGGDQRYFCLMAGIGLDGAIVRDVRRHEKRFFKQGAYLLSALRQMRRWDSQNMLISCEDQKISCNSVIISNAARYGGDFVIAPGQDIFTPLLTVVCITSDQRRTYLRLAVDLLLNRDWQDISVSRFTTKNLLVSCTKPIQLDGDFAGCGPAQLSIIDNFARIIV